MNDFAKQRWLRLSNWLAAFVAATCSVSLGWRATHVRKATVDVLVPTSPTLEMGTIQQNETVTSSIELKNNSDSILEIEAIVPGCSCTATMLGTSVLKPKCSTQLQVTFASHAKRGKTVQSIVLSYRLRGDATPQLLKLDVIATIQPR